MSHIKPSLSALLVKLRGPYTRAQVATALGRSRQAVGDLESGNCSMARLEALEDFYGVDFQVVAIDRRTGRFWNGTAAPGLVQRIEGNTPPALLPTERRVTPPALAAERPPTRPGARPGARVGSSAGAGGGG